MKDNLTRHYFFFHYFRNKQILFKMFILKIKINEK